jgi:hypothetical protein
MLLALDNQVSVLYTFCTCDAGVCAPRDRHACRQQCVPWVQPVAGKAGFGGYLGLILGLSGSYLVAVYTQCKHRYNPGTGPSSPTRNPAMNRAPPGAKLFEVGKVSSPALAPSGLACPVYHHETTPHLRQTGQPSTLHPPAQEPVASGKCGSRPSFTTCTPLITKAPARRATRLAA